MANIDEWRWKLSLLLRSADEQEIVSRDKRDRRDYEQIANLTQRMGLYRFGSQLQRHLFPLNKTNGSSLNLAVSLIFFFSQQYGKVVVASKVPLPNYRPDLDDKRPQREVRII